MLSDDGSKTSTALFFSHSFPIVTALKTFFLDVNIFYLRNRPGISLRKLILTSSFLENIDLIHTRNIIS